MKIKFLFLFVTLLPIDQAFSQDYKAIDQFLKTNISIHDFSEKGEFESLNLLLSVDDCDKCIPQINSYIKNTEKLPYTINIITNNKAYTKKVLGDDIISKYNLYYNKEVFLQYLNGSSGIYYKDMSNSIYANEEDIKIKIKNAEERDEHFKHFVTNKDILLSKDSVMTDSPYIHATLLTKNKLLVYDNKVNTALVITLQPKNNSLLAIQNDYYIPTITNPKKLYELPFTEKNLLSFEETKQELLKDRINLINIYSLSYWEQTYYIVFGITRIVKNEHNNNMSYYPDYYIATLETENADTQSMLDPSIYNIYYKIDNLQYENLNGPVHLNLIDKPFSAKKNQLSWRARIKHPNERKTTYLGLVTILLQNNTAQIISVDREFEEFVDQNTLFRYDNKNYHLTRDSINEETNEGIFLLKEFEPDYSNRFLERL